MIKEQIQFGSLLFYISKTLHWAFIRGSVFLEQPIFGSELGGWRLLEHVHLLEFDSNSSNFNQMSCSMTHFFIFVFSE